MKGMVIRMNAKKNGKHTEKKPRRIWGIALRTGLLGIIAASLLLFGVACTDNGAEDGTVADSNVGSVTSTPTEQRPAVSAAVSISAEARVSVPITNTGRRLPSFASTRSPEAGVWVTNIFFSTGNSRKRSVPESLSMVGTVVGTVVVGAVVNVVAAVVGFWVLTPQAHSVLATASMRHISFVIRFIDSPRLIMRTFRYSASRSYGR